MHDTNRHDDYDRIDMNSRDIYSSGSHDISSSSQQRRTARPENWPEDWDEGDRPQQRRQPQRPAKKKRRKKKLHIGRFLLVAVLLLAVLCGSFYAYAYKVVDKIDRQPLDNADLGITTSNYDGVKNIALLGIDTHEDNDVGRSDAIVILTIDKKHKKLKMTSLARDTYVAIDGHDHSKLTHAYAYGKSQLAVKTLNQNFGLEITDYVTVNFFEFARIIDYVGGVTIDVDEAEMNEMNTNIIPFLGEMGIPCDLITQPGVQLLSGGQAVCYARIRHTDSDIVRGNRQKEVLSAMISQVKHMNPLKLPKLAELTIAQCATSLSTKDIMSIGTWVLTRSPSIEQLSVPNDNIPSTGKTIGGGWYYVYDLSVASADIHDFIFEENFYTPEAVAERAAAAAEEEAKK